MSTAATSFTHYGSSPRVLYRAILRELRKSALSPEATSSSSLREVAGTASSSTDLIASAQSELAASRAGASAEVSASITRRPPPAFLLSPVLPFVRQALRKGSDPAAQGEQDRRTSIRDLADVELFMRSKRIHGELLLRYNPTHGMSEQERVKATARRVGLDVPLEYDPNTADEAGAMAAATLASGSEDGASAQQKKPYTGPLPPPKLDDD
ncbi:hypothetical protein OC846_000207 [Tilletia horrida]|uniref:Uncharacterized protein n=1 Tax=Tilletia horrida TaxID=155126 RepID=A0AAN6H1D0_9BASI|nr:hypothetical protein OC846_000207 [Tilletia horrida]